MSRGSRAGVGDRDAPDLGIVLGRHDDIERGGEDAVVAHEFRAILGEHDLVAVGPRAARLVGRRPDLAAGDIAQEDVAAPIVARRVLAPARDGVLAPAAVARAGGRQHHRVAAVGQQMHRRAGRVRVVQAAHDGGLEVLAPWRRHQPPRRADGRRRRRAACAPAAAARSPGSSARRGSGCASRRRAARWRWPRSSCPGGAPCRRARPPGPGLPAGATGEVERLVEAVAAAPADAGQPREVGRRRRRIDHGGERRRVGRDDDVLARGRA